MYKMPAKLLHHPHAFYRNRCGSVNCWKAMKGASQFLSGPKRGSARPIGIEPETKTAFHLCSPADSKAHAGVGQAKAEASFAHSQRCRGGPSRPHTLAPR